MLQRSQTARLARPVSNRDHVLGPADAAVTLVEYGDFECPFCGMAYGDLKRIRIRVGDRLRFVYRHFPRPEHPHARRAAEASESAAAQGEDYFWAMHDQLFEHQKALEDQDLLRYAADIGLDLQRFSQDLGRHSYLERVQQDLEDAVRSGVHGTPAFFLNGERYVGRARADDLYRAILRQLGDEVLLDEVDEAASESFPASDPPGWIPLRL